MLKDLDLSLVDFVYEISNNNIEKFQKSVDSIYETYQYRQYIVMTLSLGLLVKKCQFTAISAENVDENLKPNLKNLLISSFDGPEIHMVKF